MIPETSALSFGKYFQPQTKIIILDEYLLVAYRLNQK